MIQCNYCGLKAISRSVNRYSKNIFWVNRRPMDMRMLQHGRKFGKENIHTISNYSELVPKAIFGVYTNIIAFQDLFNYYTNPISVKKSPPITHMTLDWNCINRPDGLKFKSYRLDYYDRLL